jgi:hypothetical protein
MSHGQKEAGSGRGTCKRCVRAVETCPSKAQPVRRSRGAHLVSISMISTFTPRRACTRSSQIALFSRDCAQKRELWTSPTNWLHAQFDRACNQLVGSGLVGRTPTAIALQSGSEGNRHKTSDPNHLRLDPVISHTNPSGEAAHMSRVGRVGHANSNTQVQTSGSCVAHAALTRVCTLKRR